jgi:hypothetical protein
MTKGARHRRPSDPIVRASGATIDYTGAMLADGSASVRTDPNDYAMSHRLSPVEQLLEARRRQRAVAIASEIELHLILGRAKERQCEWHSYLELHPQDADSARPLVEEWESLEERARQRLAWKRCAAAGARPDLGIELSAALATRALNVARPREQGATRRVVRSGARGDPDEPGPPLGRLSHGALA